MKGGDFELACMVLWSIWQEKNAQMWKGVNASPMVVWQRVASWLLAFQEANTNTSRSGGLFSPRWTPPPQGWVKRNNDGALRVRDKLGGV